MSNTNYLDQGACGGLSHWEHFKEAKKTVVGWGSLWGASERSDPGGIGLGISPLPLPIYNFEMLPSHFCFCLDLVPTFYSSGIFTRSSVINSLGFLTTGGKPGATTGKLLVSRSATSKFNSNKNFNGSSLALMP